MLDVKFCMKSEECASFLGLPSQKVAYYKTFYKKISDREVVPVQVAVVETETVFLHMTLQIQKSILKVEILDTKKVHTLT